MTDPTPAPPLRWEGSAMRISESPSLTLPKGRGVPCGLVKAHPLPSQRGGSAMRIGKAHPYPPKGEGDGMRIGFVRVLRAR